MSCCKNDLGRFPHNEDIDTGLVAAQSGIHKLRFTGANYSRFSIYIRFDDGGAIVIPSGILNEDFAYTLEIIQPDATFLSQNDCNNFALTTFINKIACSDEQYL